MQDLPFSDKTLKLSSNTEIKVPNVLRTMVPDLIVQQYHIHCQETGFVPMSRTTLYRILKECEQIPSRTWLCLSSGCKSVWRITWHPKTKWQRQRQRPLMAKRPEQSCWFELFSDTLFATLLEIYYLTRTDKDDFLQTNNVQILSLTNKTPWEYSFRCTVAQRVNPCEWNDLQFGVTSQWLCAQLNTSWEKIARANLIGLANEVFRGTLPLS